ncbi:MAG: hypothetical protein KDD82_08185 [Planctomycetes bacterium]|nr:hypothetical protein [Planctomycetota bacterium]
MKKLVVVCTLALLCSPVAYGGLFGGLSRRAKKRHIARQKEANLRFQERATAFFDVDAIPDYDANLRELEQLTDLRSQTGAFSRFSSQSSRIPAYRLLEGGGLGGLTQRRGHHTSTSLPFLDTRSQQDLAFKLEAVKISEAALAELRQAPDGAAGGFHMMKFLDNKLMRQVSSRQKGLVNSMLVLVTVPYFATLASTWWMGPNTAMDITWPGAKQGISSMIEQVLKRYGRIGAGTNLQNYAGQLAQSATLPGAGSLGRPAR